MGQSTVLIGAILLVSGQALADDSAPVEDVPSKECSVVVMNLVSKGLDPKTEGHIPGILTTTMAGEIANSTHCKVITQSDIARMLDFEAEKAACSDVSESCVAEVGNALGVDLIVGGSVGKLGNSYTFQANLSNVAEGAIKARFDEVINGDPVALSNAAKKAGRQLLAGVGSAPKSAVDTGTPSTNGSASAANTPGNASAKQDPDTKESPAASGEKTASANDSATQEDGGGTGLILAGGGVALVSLAVVAGGAGLAAYMNLLVKNAPAGADADTLANQRLVGIGGLGVAVLGGIGVIAGAGLATVGMLE